MKLENQVCSLNPAKKLEKLGVKQESVWWWNATEIPRCLIKKKDVITELPKPEPNFDTVFRWKVVSKNHVVPNGLAISAFTVAELGERLSRKYQIFFGDDGWDLVNPFSKDWYMKGGWEQIKDEKTEANARAKMLIYLIENKLVKIK